MDYHNTRYWALDKEVERCYKRSGKAIIGGKKLDLGKESSFWKERIS